MPPTASLRAKPLRRHLTAPLYRFESALDTAARGRRYWHNWPRGKGWVYSLGADLFAVRGPSGPRYVRQLHRRNRRHPVPHPPPAYGPAQALFDSTSRRLTPYRYDRLLPISDGRIRFERYAARRTYGYLDPRGREVLGPYDAAGPFSHGRAVVVTAGAPTPNDDQYALIDTTGAYVLAPQPRRLDGPDALGFVRRAVPRAGKGNVAEYLRPNGQPAFPGRYFGWGDEFKTDSAAVPDTLGRPGILYSDGRWLPRPAPAKPIIRAAPRPTVQEALNDRFRLIKSDGQPLNAETYAWAKALAGDWFAARPTPEAAMLLLTPAGQPYPLPPGYEPDLMEHSVANAAEVPFANGLLKVRWGKPFREGGEPRREAYMTRSGRILTSDLKGD
ncbi:hypothetical protein B0919_20445 [Hymenobacter sp. CRA2]|nr:hypothetical protein B0919_20445 [Hymenobacter sp. CRA2]